MRENKLFSKVTLYVVWQWINEAPCGSEIRETALPNSWRSMRGFPGLAVGSTCSHFTISLPSLKIIVVTTKLVSPADALNVILALPYLGIQDCYCANCGKTTPSILFSFLPSDLVTLPNLRIPPRSARIRVGLATFVALWKEGRYEGGRSEGRGSFSVNRTPFLP